jgi:dTDP-4-amino-4,6-dideoxygalactose transaminase
MTSLSWDRHKGHVSTYDVVDLGYNYRIDEMRSALGRVQLGKLPASNKRRRELTALYRELLSELTPEIKMPFSEAHGVSSLSCYHILPVLLPPETDRAKFMEGMKAQGIQTSIHYPPVHRFHIYEDEWSSRNNPLPLTEEVSARQVTLPLYATMQEDQVELVARAARQVLMEMQ